MERFEPNPDNVEIYATHDVFLQTRKASSLNHMN